MNNLSSVKNIMLGHLENNLDLVIMTPLKSTFEALITQLGVTKIYDKCFFRNGLINYKDKKILIVMLPQGIASKDIVELFSDTNMLFFGLAGSLDLKYEIGEFFEVDKAVYNSKIINLNVSNKFKKVKCGYSPCLLGELADEYCDKARKEKCNIVDMEIAVCAATARKKNNRFLAFVLISDIPHKVNFWEVTKELQEKISKERRNAVKEIIEYIDIFGRE